MNGTQRALLVVLTLALGGCSQFRVRSDHDPGADFAGLHTFAWLPIEEAQPADQRVLDRYIDNRIRTDVDKDLRAKGYEPAGPAGPDFLLNYRLASEPADAVRGRGRVSYGIGWVAWPGADQFYRDSYEAGTLYLAVVDPRSKRTIWLGAASARLLPHVSLEKRAKRVDDVVAEILARFPPK